MSERQVPCPHCKQSIVLSAEQRASVMACPHCGRKFAIEEKGEAGRRVGHYEIIEKVGAGQMGAVFKARNPDDDRVVALKLLKTSLAKGGTFIQRFRREAQAATLFDHPYLVKAFEYGEADGYHYYAMEFVDGETLEEKLGRGERLDEGQALYVARCVAEGLAYAWERGIVHRDIKPGNVMIERDGRIRVMDMGLAKDVRDEAATVTQAGGVLGSPAYAAPEQLSGQVKVDVRADIYALGTTLFHLVCGRPPFVGETAGVVASKNLSEPLPDPRELAPEATDPFCSFLVRLTEKDPDDRYQTPQEVLEAIGKVAAGEDLGAPVVQLKRKRRRGPDKPLFGGRYPYLLPASMGLLIIFSIWSAWYLYRMIASPDSGRRGRKTVSAEFPSLGSITIATIFNAKLYALGGAGLKMEYDFSRSSQFFDWGYRGEAPGELACWGAGRALNAKFAREGLEIECDATLVQGTSLGITVFDHDAPDDFSVALIHSCDQGAYVRAGEDQSAEPEPKSKLAPLETHRLSLRIDGNEAVGKVGEHSFRLRIRPPKSVAIRLHAGPGGAAVFDNVKVSGTIDTAWAEEEMVRERNRIRMTHDLEYYGQANNHALQLSPGAAVKLPDGFAGLREWTVEMFALVLHCPVGAGPGGLPLFLCQPASGEPDVFTIDPESCRLQVRFGRSSPAQAPIMSLVPINRGRWHHLALTFDGQRVRLYLDGVLDTARKLAAGASGGADLKFVGLGNPDLKAGFEELVIDDFRISNKVVYTDDTFAPQPARKADGNTWLLFEFNETEGNAARNSASQDSAGEVTKGEWVRSDQPIKRATWFRSTLTRYERSGKPVEIPADGQWHETGIFIPKGAELILRLIGTRARPHPSEPADKKTAQPETAAPVVMGLIHPGQAKPFKLGSKVPVAATGAGLLRLKCDGAKAGIAAAVVLLWFSD